MTTVLETLVVKLAGDAGDYDKTIGGAQKSLDSFSKGAKEVGGKLTTSVTLPLIGLGAAATAMATEFNAGMANVASLGLVPERVAELKVGIQATAIAVGKGTSDMADGAYQVVSAFGDSSETLRLLEINAKAGAAGLATTTDAINLTSAVTKGYGDTSADAVQHAADLAFQTVKLGQTDFPALAASIGKVVPLAASLGVKQEDLFAVMATATGVTGGAAEVATQLRGVLQSLMAPTGDMTTLIEEMGFASGSAMLEQLGMQGTIAAIVGAAEASGEPLQKYISSIEGQTLALALAGPQADTYAEKTAAMADVTGQADAAFAAQTEGINKTGFSMAQAAVKGQVLLQKLGDGLAPAISKVIDKAGPWVDKLIEMADWFVTADESTQGWILGIVAIAAAAGPVISVIGTLAGGVSAVVGVIGGIGGATALVGGLGAALTVLTGPIGLTVAAVAGLAWAWNADFLGMKTATLGMIDNVKAGWPGFVDGLRTKWGDFTGWIGPHTNGALETVKGFWQSHSEQVQAINSNQWESIKLATQIQMDATRGVMQAGMQFAQGDWQGGMETLRSTVDNAWAGIKQIFDLQLDNIRNLFAFFGWEQTGEDIARGIRDGLTRGAEWIASAARDAAQRALDAAKSWLGISSPSKRAALEIGAPFGEGVGVGAEKGLGTATSRIQQSLDAMLGDLSLEAGRAGGAGMAGGGGVGLRDIIVYIGGPADYAAGRQAGRGILDEMRMAGLA